MGPGQPTKLYAPQEYYRIEREASHKSHFYSGEIFAMAGGTVLHSLICSNVIGEIGNRLKGKPCAAYESNLRLKIKSTGLRCYPDASVFCGPFEFDPEDSNQETVTNPTVLFEVLSPSTEAYDRGFKANNYRQLESLRAYVLISQIEAHAEIYTRQTDGSWSLREAKGLDATLSISSIAVDLPLAEIYDRVEFIPAPKAPTPQAKTPRA
jgi:Uma2 family endonuclease